MLGGGITDFGSGCFRADGAVTAMCNAISAVHPGFGNTAPVQLEVDPQIANDPEGVEKMCAMVRAIIDSGNTLLNINIIDANDDLTRRRSVVATHFRLSTFRKRSVCLSCLHQLYINIALFSLW